MSQLQSLLDELNATSTRFEVQVPLPIKNLCGMKVDVYFVRIRGCKTLHTHVEFGCERIPVNAPALPLTLEGLGQAIAQLDELKFSKRLDQFYVGESPPVYDDLFTGTNYTPKYEECAVCLDRTIRKTQCKHALCLACESKLVRRACPLCRETIERRSYDDESDDE